MLTLQINDKLETLERFPAEATLLNYLRETRGLTGTKEGCASGDCGACTVMVERAHGAYDTVNACITPLGAVQGRHVITVEGLGNANDGLHPVQQAMIDHHGSQCGFCTPGFVVSLAAHGLRASPASDRTSIVHAISGNLCRCTGYRPIIEAGIEGCARQTWQPMPAQGGLLAARGETVISETASGWYQRPRTEDALAALLQNHPQARVVAGATDLWLEVTQQNKAFDRVVDVSDIADLQNIEVSTSHVDIGAAVTHDALAQYLADEHSAATDELLARFGSPQIRHRGTLGGNIGNASPIADWPPLLMCLDATLVLRKGDSQREIPLTDFYTGYRSTVLAPGEFISRVRLPVPVGWQSLRFHKVSKRIEDDISSVAGAFRLTLDNGVLVNPRVAYGGMAATPVRLTAIEAAISGRAPGALDPAQLGQMLAAELTPISDVRASAAYRLAMAQNMLQRSLMDLS